MAEKWEDLRDALVSTIEARAKEFLDQNKVARDLIVERSGALAKYALKYAANPNDADQLEMNIIRQTITNEIDALALNASSGAKNLFKALVGIAFDSLVKALPALVGAIA
ncbi:MAG: hypothetical protein U0236_21295 [Nitrospira sp.]